MSQNYEKLKRCYDAVRKQVDFVPRVAVVLGSGLGQFAQQIEIRQTVEYDQIEGFPQSTVEGHKGRFVFGYCQEIPVVIMQGRIHYYEGYEVSDVVLPIRLMHLLGASALVLTNAAGGVNEQFSPGDLMLIKDHINVLVPNPLLGANAEELGERFPDMSSVYPENIRREIRTAAARLQIPLQEGVYMQFSGPSYETPAEVRMSRILGADAVGMSTACEAVAAQHMGMKICGISCITNMASGITQEPLSHAEVQKTADRTALQFEQLLTEVIQIMAASDTLL
ncbi:MAG: purine-nucleoside phosphorylase [Lachnospiraceae bacterium]